jgi:uncharacterized PurR-regulated membrane protein YhhQ (DUF165 family)
VTAPTPAGSPPAAIVRFWAAVAYLGSIVVANWLTARYGFVPVGFGLAATAGTYAAGMAFVARDAVQDTAGRVAVLGALVVGAVLSWWLSTPALAFASAAAFGASELADMAIYTPLRRRGYLRAALASNTIGAVVDTWLFLALAGFAITPVVFAGQLVGKGWVTLLAIALVLAVRRRRAPVLRDRIRAEGA